jgi:hypothetical protein
VEIEFRVLGPFEVLWKGAAARAEKAKQHSLLALQLLHADQG